jgi:putative chitinase
MKKEELALIDKLYDDDAVESIQHAAYIMATVKHETANTFRPIEEYGKGKGHKYAPTYYGRGYVQLTWDYNYKKFSQLLGIDLFNNPSLATDPDIAYKIMIIGMNKGLFTGKKLLDYINLNKVDYYNARRIINGMDKASLISSYARQYEIYLNSAWD